MKNPYEETMAPAIALRLLLDQCPQTLEWEARLNGEKLRALLVRVAAEFPPVASEVALNPPAPDRYEAAALAAGWRHGGDNGGFWFDGNCFDSWKAAASADDDCPTYATAREVCEAEGLTIKK